MKGRLRAGWRRLALGLPTLLGLKRCGYFIPYRYAAGIPAAAERAGYPHIETLFAAAEADFRRVLDAADGWAEALLRFDGAEPPRPRWRQDWYPRLDGLAAYCLTRMHAPRRIVEIGSGHSTRFLAAAVADGGLDTAIAAIDPCPRADLAGLPSVRLERTTLQRAGRAAFDGLEAGDLLAVDSSHIAMPGSDVDRLVAETIPALPAGALLAIHDIFLPDPYPEGWAWRGYNEQTAVAALIAGGGFRPLWSSRYAATRMADAVAASIAGKLPLGEAAYESALWLVKA